MTEPTREPPDLGALTRELTEQWQALAKQLYGAGKPELGPLGMAAPLKQWLSLMETATAQAALPVAQMQAFIDTLRAQREQIRVLQTQLTAFDKQVIALEQGLVPFLTWGQQWVRMQESVLGQMRDLGR